MIKVSDYVAAFVRGVGVTDVFTVSGGGIMHLIDSFGREPSLRFVCNYHEQACAISAESYARTRDGVGVCLVTTGPGSVNALSGLAGAWVDSIPVLVISGQVRRDLIADYSRLRQLGPQEINIDGMAKPVTKYFATVLDPKEVRFELEKAYWLATTGRPGPAWINIPLDVQGSVVEPVRLKAFRPAPATLSEGVRDATRRVLSMLRESRCPLLVPGNGIHLAGATAEFRAVADRLQIPVSPTLGGMDLLEDTHPLNVGRFGPIGQRHANFIVQNADLIVAVGASMSVSTVGFNTERFAPGATKIMVNVDEHEIAKARPQPDLAVTADAGDFLRAVLGQERIEWGQRLERWWRACEEWKREYPLVTDDYTYDREHVNSYIFAKVLSECASHDDVILTGNSLDAWSIYQAFGVKSGQRVFTNINFGAMGWDLPAAVGACTARAGRRTLLITGDGSVQFNIQELQTIRHNSLCVKIFVLNNGGYASIRSTQQTHFGGHLVGSDQASGVSSPDFRALAQAYGLEYSRIADNDQVRDGIRHALQSDAASLCEVNVAYDQGRTPRVVSRKRDDGTMESGTLENMFPFLPPEEVERSMGKMERRGAEERG